MIVVNTTQKNADKFNENPKNFLLAEAMKIFTESNDENTKLQALELICKVERTY
ncbi:hypothetical protein SAMN02745120_0632 [Acetoanaerobium noterae]|uniref:Uncharacterized protein n=1 Tax=Acetoanaerobium noterae TaxID=745369 RepID=A0A1T5A0N1_9FIRM|nr:hypothetical protein [Acetoanaerobium noterae]SKB28581.1 hypothetical protein SAMN02745120_0632 [Acetoanaerobium noterae]